MSFPMYAAMLSSQLIVTIADRVPEFDVGPGCRESAIPDCQAMEKIARDRLIKDWQTFTAHDKAMCVMEEKCQGRRAMLDGSPVLKSTPMRAALRRRAGTLLRRETRLGLKDTVASAESYERKVDSTGGLRSPRLLSAASRQQPEPPRLQAIPPGGHCALPALSK